MSGLLIGLKYVSLKDVGLKDVVVPTNLYHQSRGDGTIDIPSSVFYVYHPAAPGSNPDGTHYLCFSRGLKRKTIGQPTVLLIV